MSSKKRPLRTLFKGTMMLTATLLAATAGIMVAVSARSQTRYHTLEIEAISASRTSAPKEEVDWSSLRRQNPDIVGWLTVEEVNISYPVVAERGDRSGGWYLRHDFWGRASTLGCPYIDSRCTSEDSHVLIYAHTMDMPGSMFTPLSHAYEQRIFSRVGDAHWSTPEHEEATFKPLMSLKVDASYPTIQQFRFSSNDDLHSFLCSLADDASCHTEHLEDLIKRAQRVLSLVTCPSTRKGERSRTIVIFVKPYEES